MYQANARQDAGSSLHDRFGRMFHRAHRSSTKPRTVYRVGPAGAGDCQWPTLECTRVKWSTPRVEPVTALLTIGGAHGVSVLVRALSGSTELGQVSSELFRALTETESRIDTRLSTIEDLLDDLLEQPYTIALGDGVRHFLDAGIATDGREAALDRARDRFITATSAATSALQRAIAERYILLCLLAQARLDLVPASMARMEVAATAAAFDAAFKDAVIAERDWKTAAKLLGRRDAKGSRVASQGREAPVAIRAAAVDSIGICGRLLDEAAMLAPALGLPPRAAPPPPRDISNSPTRIPIPQWKSGGQQFIYHVIENPYWAFEARPAETLRVGSLSVEFLPVDNAEPATQQEETRAANAQALAGVERERRGHIAHVNLEAPLSRPITIAAATADISPRIDQMRTTALGYTSRAVPPPPVRTISLRFDRFHDQQLGPSIASTELPIPPDWPGVIKIGTPGAIRAFITVTCMA